MEATPGYLARFLMQIWPYAGICLSFYAAVVMALADNVRFPLSIVRNTIVVFY